MKNLFTLILLAFALSASAQGNDKREQIKALKTAFITTELSLTSDEAAKFWPVYNSFDEKQFELKHQKMRALGKKIEGIDSMSDKEALVVINQMEDYEEELFQNRRKLVSSLKSIISPVKILKLKKAEDDFNRKLLRQYKEKGPRK
ncbi:sensor of ECF-type sigma factor [Flavobacterium sp. WW92]|uniref:sensor of ECF-type sigma factor n=1 Tax=unclassified Flavobacterium TaxID=196869 RepID=UPI002224C726|nr:MULTISPECIES: sensor of ECF-type sigma factor [unclassified Flavobacterium]WDO12535.1 sensor of ECF-type sigma factor [Flavobacterium sp. WW92]